MGFSTFVLDKAKAQRRKEQEARRVQLLDKIQRVLDALSRRVPFEDAYIFGSVAKPLRFSEKSDVDVGFVGLKDEDFFMTMSYLSRQTGQDVDVVQMEGSRLSDKIKREGVRWERKN